MKSALAILLLAVAASAEVLLWDSPEVSYDGENFETLTFSVYHSNDGQQWQLLGTTTNLGYRITEPGWYGVTSSDGHTNTLLDDAKLFWHGTPGLRLQVLFIGGGQ
jgi:hypothetical protein